jgi:putative sigma-54 modulation protein
MRVEYSGKNLSLTDALKGKAEKKIAKLEKFTGPIVSVHASFEVERHLHNVNLVVHCARERTYKATGTAEDMYLAINDAAGAIEQQAKKEKTKRLAGRTKGRATSPAELMTGEEEEEEAPSGARRRQAGVTPRDDLFHPKPLRLADAVLLLGEAPDPVLVYEDQDSGRISVIYKDKREGICLVSPPVKT